MTSQNVGYCRGQFLDPTRSHWRLPEPRPIVWSAWYPAKTEASGGGPARGQPIGPRRSALFRMAPVLPNAALDGAAERWPVVLMSHGTGGLADGMCWLGHALAKRGFVAISVCHHGNTAIEPYLPEGFLCWWERPRDLTLALDMLSGSGRFAGRLDLARVYAAGYSLGSHTVLQLAGAETSLDEFERWRVAQGGHGGGPREFPDLEQQVPVLWAEQAVFRQSLARHGASYRDDRVRGILALAPAPPVRSLTAASLKDIKVPVHLVAAAGDVEAPLATGAAWLSTQNPGFRLTVLDGELGHQVFLPLPTTLGRKLAPDLCMDATPIRRASVHRAIGAMAATLFAAH